MLDLNVELGRLIDEPQHADVEFAVAGSLATRSIEAAASRDASVCYAGRTIVG